MLGNDANFKKSLAQEDHQKRYISECRSKGAPLQPFFRLRHRGHWVARDDYPKSVNFQVAKNNFLKVNFSFFPLKSTTEVSQRPKLQFSPIHAQRVREASCFKF